MYKFSLSIFLNSIITATLFTVCSVPVLASDRVAMGWETSGEKFYCSGVQALQEARKQDNNEYVNPHDYPEKCASLFRQSMHCYKSAIVLNGATNPTIDDLISYGSACYNSGEYNEAILPYNKAVKLLESRQSPALPKNTPGRIFAKVAECNFQLENYQAAIDNYEKARKNQYTLSALDNQRDVKSQSEMSKSMYRKLRSMGSVVELVNNPQTVKLSPNQKRVYDIPCCVNERDTKGFMYDTGCAITTIPYEYCKDLGIDTSKLSFNIKSNTANGVTFLAPARINLEVLNVLKVINLNVQVAPQKALFQPLLGQDMIQLLKCSTENNILTYSPSTHITAHS